MSEKKYIDIKKRMKQWGKLCDAYFPNLPCERLEDFILRAPAADVVEVRHGEWISESNKVGVNVGMKCSICSARIKYSEFFNGNHNFCHKCGAKMDGERKENP